MGLENEKTTLTAKQQRALEALLSEPTIQAAAEAAGVSKATIFRWLGDSVFSDAYRDLRGQMLESTMAALQQASGDAVRVLKEVMTDGTAKGSERVSAARCVLEMTLRSREMLEYEERLRALEEQMLAQQSRGRKIA